MNPTTYYIIWTNPADGEQYNEGEACSEKEAQKRIAEITARAAKNGLNVEGQYYYSTNQFN
jgi:arabinogalactan endo-1,4-beta-galactosidase